MGDVQTPFAGRIISFDLFRLSDASPCLHWEAGPDRALPKTLSPDLISLDTHLGKAKWQR